MKDFFKHLQDVFFPDPKKKNCPHCSGGKCLSLCGILGEQADGQVAQGKDKVMGHGERSLHNKEG